MRVFLAVLFLALATGSTLAAMPDEPFLRVEAPPELEAFRQRVERLGQEQVVRLARFVGLEKPGEPIRVVLAPDGSPVESATPKWIAGYAYGALGTVVLFPERSPPYPYGSFDEVLLHELVHVLAARAAGSQEVPRWFSEGLAMVAAGGWGLDDRSRLTLAAVVDPNTPMAEIEAMFRGSRGEAARAYALSGAFVRDLLQHKGENTVEQILARCRLGLPFAEAFRRTVGVDPETAGRAFWKRYSIWYRWVPLATSSLTLWVGITLLAVWAGLHKRRRRAALEEMWEAEAGGDAGRPSDWVH